MPVMQPEHSLEDADVIATPLLDDLTWRTLLADESDRQSSDNDSYIARFQQQLNLSDDDEEDCISPSKKAEFTIRVRRELRHKIDERLNRFTKLLSPSQKNLVDWARRSYSLELRSAREHDAASNRDTPKCILTGSTADVVGLVFRAQVGDTHVCEMSEVFNVSPYGQQVIRAWNILSRFEDFLHRVVYIKRGASAAEAREANSHEHLLRSNVNEGAFFLHAFFDHYMRRHQHTCHIAI